MRTAIALEKSFEEPFQVLLADFLVKQGVLASVDDLRNKRYLARSIAPHVQKLSQLFNRLDPDGGPDQSSQYWKESSNPEHLRLAYFLSFMPPNAMRMASVWMELAQLGYRLPPHQKKGYRCIDWGTGPCSSLIGIAAAEQVAPLGLGMDADFALIEQNQSMLQLGTKWAHTFFEDRGFPTWTTRPFHRKISWDQPLLPRTAPKFHIWTANYFINEATQPIDTLADRLVEAWDRHLEPEGLVILVEPALKKESRKILALRKAILARTDMMQVLLPCLGHQACPALADAEDWCHEEVSWWRPPYLRLLDDLTRLDRKSLPFSYLVLKKTKEGLSTSLPGVDATRDLHRLVSPSRKIGPDHEFFTCGNNGDGKKRCRALAKNCEVRPMRGDILLGGTFRGHDQSTRVEGADWVTRPGVLADAGLEFNDEEIEEITDSDENV